MKFACFIWLLLLSAIACAQTGNTVTTQGTGAPTGACSSIQRYVDITNNNLYFCSNGSWVQANGASGTTINATNNVLPKRSNATAFVDSALTDSGTTITSTEPFRLPSGSSSAPSYTYSSETNTGMYRDDVATQCFVNLGAVKFCLASGTNAEFDGSMAIVWGNGDAKQVPDAGLARGAAGVVIPRPAGNSAAYNGLALGTETITFSATPTFDCTKGDHHKITLTNNVTSSTLSGCVTGQPVIMQICQDSGGSHTFVFPANMLGGTTVGSTASKCNSQFFIYDGTSAYAVAAGTSNL